MRLSNRNVPLEKFEIGFPTEALESPAVKAKLVCIMRFLSDLSSEIADFECKWSDVQTVRSRACRTMEDCQYFLYMRENINEYIRLANSRANKYTDTSLVSLKMDGLVTEKVRNCVSKYIRRKTANIRHISRMASSRLGNLLSYTNGRDEMLMDERGAVLREVEDVLF